jgi:hypothetical protein
VHQHDYRLPACSEDALGDQLSAGTGLRAELALLPNESLSASQRTDGPLAAGLYVSSAESCRQAIVIMGVFRIGNKGDR